MSRAALASMCRSLKTTRSSTAMDMCSVRRMNDQDREHDAAGPTRENHRQAIGGPPLSDADHFWKCEACSGWFNMCDLGAALDHEGPLPHPACDQMQWRRQRISARRDASA